MSTTLEFGRDAQGYNAFAPRPSTNIFSATLVTGVASSITLPANSKEWVISFSQQPGTNIFVDYSGATAALPAGGSFAVGTSELNPGARKLSTFARDNVTQNTISVITNNATAEVTISLYEIRHA